MEFFIAILFFGSLICGLGIFPWFIYKCNKDGQNINKWLIFEVTAWIIFILAIILAATAGGSLIVSKSLYYVSDIIAIPGVIILFYVIILAFSKDWGKFGTYFLLFMILGGVYSGLQSLGKKTMNHAQARTEKASKKRSSVTKPKNKSHKKSSTISKSKESASSKISVQKKADKKSQASQTSADSRYKKVSLAKFAVNPDKYTGKDIETSGHVTYIQKNPDDENVYYVVILPEDKYSSSGYSYGSVVEVNIDSMQESPIHEGDNITVQGGAMSSMLELNGKTLRSDIVVDNVSVH